MLRLIIVLMCVSVFAYKEDPTCVNDEFAYVECSSANIFSPEFESKRPYGNNVSCNWHVYTEDDFALCLTFHTLEIEDSLFCLKDRLALVVAGEAWPWFCGSFPSFTITNREPSVFILFKSDSAEISDGFNMTCEPIDKGNVCGDAFVSVLGSFGAPDVNDGYHKSSACTWAMFSEVDDLAQLRVTQLHIEEMHIRSNGACDNDYLEVYDDGGFIGAYCGAEPPALIEAVTKALFVTLHSDWMGADQNFQAHYAITGRYKVIRPQMLISVVAEFLQKTTSADRDGDGAYDTDLSCTWLIVAPKRFIIGINFDYDAFGIEDSPEGDCGYDSLTITEYMTGANTKLCGYRVPKPMVYLSNKLIVEFNADYFQSGDVGFKMFISHFDSAVVPTNETNENFHIRNSTLSITSPGFRVNNNYAADISYTWKITFEDEHALQIAFHTFDIEESDGCTKDSVSIASDKRIIAFCGSIRPCAVVLWAKYTHEVSIWFKSDLDGTSKGFNLTCTAIEESKLCGETLRHGVQEHVVGSFSLSVIGDLYRHATGCTWIIISEVFSVSSALKQIYFEEINIGPSDECGTDYLEVYDLTNFNKTFCGITPPPVIELITQAIFVTLHSDWMMTNQSFNAHYSIADAERPCGGILTLADHFRRIVPPGFELAGYDPDMVCKWLIVAPYLTFIRMLFIKYFEIDESPDGSCTYDSLTITDYSTMAITRLCGYVRPAPMHYHSKKLLVEFYSDNIYTGNKGFVLKYRQLNNQCGTFTGNVISSPSFDEDQDMEIYCESIMYLYTNETVLITFLSIGIVESERCTKGYVEISNSRFCGSYIPPEIKLSSKSGADLVKIIYYIDYAHADGGFNLTYTASNDTACCCTEFYGHGSIYPPADNCTWTIMSRLPNQTIQLYIARLDSNPTPYTCETDYIEIRDDNGHIGNFCWTTKQQRIISTSRTVYVSRHSKESVHDNRLMHIWFVTSLDNDNPCGGIKLCPEGRITSQGIETHDDFYVRRVWLLIAPDDNIILLQFIKIVLQHTYKCRNSSLEVWERDNYVGHKLTFTRSLTFCDVVNPPEYPSSSSVLLIKFFSYVTQMTGEFILEFKHACWRQHGLSVNCTGTDKTVDVSNAVYRDGQTRPLQLACDPRVDSPHAVMDKTYRVIWSRYDSVIKSSKKYSVNIKRFSLAIINPDLSDIGEYRCEVVFDYGTLEESNTMKLAVVKAAPQLISHTKKRSLTTHAELDLHCSFSGYPPPVVTWTKDNETITITSRFILEDFEGTINGRLFVSDVVQGDHGVYTCEASSEEFPGQEVSADISVSIKGTSNGCRKTMMPALLVFGLAQVIFGTG